MSARQLNLITVPTEDAVTRVAREAWKSILEARRANPLFKLTEDTLLGALRPVLAKELPKTKRLANGHNPLFDGLARGCGFDGKVTKAAGGQIASALKDILEVDPSVTGDELERTAKAVRRKYENAGPKAVAAHWHEFASARNVPRGTNGSAPVPLAPKGWLDALNQLYPDSTMSRGGRFEITAETDYAWAQLHHSVRDAILKAMK